MARNEILKPDCPTCTANHFPCREHMAAALESLRQPPPCACCDEIECACEIGVLTDELASGRFVDRARWKKGLICLLHNRVW